MADANVRGVRHLKSLHLGPQDILVVAKLDFVDGLALSEVETTIHRLERSVTEKYPAVHQLIIGV